MGTENYFALPDYNGNVDYKISSPATAILPKFKGLKGKPPYVHLASFKLAYTSVNESVLGTNAYRISLFPFSLVGGVVVWLSILSPNSIDSRDKKWYEFIHNYFPPDLTVDI